MSSPKIAFLSVISLIFICYSSAGLAIFDSEKYPLVLEAGVPNRTAIVGIDWSSDAIHLASIYAGSDECNIWNTATGKLKCRIKAKNQIRSLAWAPQGHYLALGLQDGSIEVWNVSTKTLAFIFYESQPVIVLCWSPDGRHLASYAKNHTHSIANGALLFSFDNASTINFWNFCPGPKIEPIKITNNISSLKWSPDGAAIAVAQNRWGSTENTAFLSIEAAKIVCNSSQENLIQIFSLPFAPDLPKLLQTYSLDEEIYSLIWSHDGRFLATLLQDGSIKMYDNVKTALMQEWYDPQLKCQISEISLSGDDHFLASGGTINLRSFGPTKIPNDISVFKKVSNQDLDICNIAWAPHTACIAIAAKDQYGLALYPNMLMIVDAHSLYSSHQQLILRELTGHKKNNF